MRSASAKSEFGWAAGVPGGGRAAEAGAAQHAHVVFDLGHARHAGGYRGGLGLLEVAVDLPVEVPLAVVHARAEVEKAHVGVAGQRVEHRLAYLRIGRKPAGAHLQ